LEFSQAVLAGQHLFGCEPYLSEQRFREEHSKGRLNDEDLATILEEELGSRAGEVVAGLDRRIDIRKAMLRHAIYAATQAEMNWLMQESDALREFRSELSAATKTQMISNTREWVERIWLGKKDVNTAVFPEAASVVQRLLDEVSVRKIAAWNEHEWRGLCLRLLWNLSSAGVASHSGWLESKLPHPSFQELLNQRCQVDADQLIDELLIKFTAMFLDQGLANFPLPQRNQGYWHCFLLLFASGGYGDAWRVDLPAQLREVQARQITPLESIAESLEDLGVGADETDDVIVQELLKLRGFAGMIEQVAQRSDRVFHGVPKSSVEEYLAVRLLLLRQAIRFIAREELRYRGPLADLAKTLRESNGRRDENGSRVNEHRPAQLAFVIFQLAQFLHWEPQKLAELSRDEWSCLITEVDSFSSVERRKIFQLAYERNYRIRALSAILIHQSSLEKPKGESSRPKFQIICCIDDREESFRRYLEELEPACETFGMAGFFAVVMYFKGLAEAHFTPLCPVIIRPNHYVREEAVYSLKKQDAARRLRRATLGRWSHGFHLGSRSLAAGWIGTSLVGPLATIPLVARILAPRFTSRLRGLFSSWLRPPEVTELLLERTHEPPQDAEGHLGFTVEEMANMVQRTLEDIGLTRRFAPLVIVAGHGSSSMNNPHESAYNCGACAGARGGPNARAFTQMANDLRVREVLNQRGLKIPSDSFFLGAYHNTCNDSFELFDLQRVPVAHRNLVEVTISVIDQARARNAHERCRRFESADLYATPEIALKHVEGRAQDLSQARPEYNHATNAMCLVGRREWSRGLYLDRRAFLTSYDPTIDDADCKILTRILSAAVPVCGGISLEYYFSTVDNEGYGAGNKLPHNITSLLGVMTGAESDLRPGLSAQMVEIHEPMRLLFVIETTPQKIKAIVEKNPVIGELVTGNWVQLATFQTETNQMHLWKNGEMVPFTPSSNKLSKVEDSLSWYQGQREHLEFASIHATRAKPRR
jgi:uncharacterized protein YbcC (UPF0753/DUF2309 family)